MNSLVIYDSYFGNTKKISQAITKELNAKLIKVKDFKEKDLEGIDLLVLGSPTRAFSPSDGVKKFLREMPNMDGFKVAVFDTRIDGEKAPSAILRFFVKIFGYASKPMLKKLERKGGERVSEPEGFYVKDIEGPLEEGELERAKKWANEIAH